MKLSTEQLKELRALCNDSTAWASVLDELIAIRELKGDQVPVAWYHATLALTKSDEDKKSLPGKIASRYSIPLFTAPQKPVVLPQAHKVRDGVTLTGDERIVMIPCNNGNWLSKFDVEHAIKMAGGIVKDGE